MYCGQTTSLANSARVGDDTLRIALVRYDMDIPDDCPFSIRPMNDEGSLFLIREKDKYGEYPNIYAKIVCSSTDKPAQTRSNGAAFIVLCDTGCGTEFSTRDGRKWNIGSFLEATINFSNKLPYLIITSHCHYDHILGIANLPSCTVLSSAFQKSFLTPRSHLAKHSLCDKIGVPLPQYKVEIWAEDFQEVRFEGTRTGITILQTPGHTPDSLTWYDSTLSPPYIFIGDSFYERQSEDTKSSKWGREPPIPTIFNDDSVLADWSRSMDKVLKFVRERNAELRTSAMEVDEDDWILVLQSINRDHSKHRVMLGAAHATVSVDAETCLLEMKDFINRILRDEVPHCRLKDEGAHEVWLWDDLLDVDASCSSKTMRVKKHLGRFTVQAPLSVVEKERQRIKQPNLDQMVLAIDTLCL